MKVVCSIRYFLKKRQVRKIRTPKEKRVSRFKGSLHKVLKGDLAVV